MALSGSQLTQNNGTGGQHAYAGFTPNESVLFDANGLTLNALFGSISKGVESLITTSQGVDVS